jgi:tRNA nucleotidyltransferase (CCA-adding enzyme)
MKEKLPKQVEFIIDKIYKHGYEAFIVGGCVRDFILGIEPNDYDITTNAKPIQIIEIFKDYKILDHGIKHGTVGIVIGNDIYEVTTYRIESEYEDNRRPKDVQFTSNIMEDLKRRDFTINAIAYNYKMGLIDAFDGVGDIHKKIVKTVGNPDERFNEDGLRIVRAIRFSSKLGFKIEDETLKSIYKNAHIVKKISKERTTEEVNKIILSENPDKLILLYKTNIFKDLGICCYFNENQYNNFEKNLNILNKCRKNLQERLLMLLYLTNDKNIQENSIIKKLKYSKTIIKNCDLLIKYMFIDEINIKSIKIKPILNKIGSENLINIFTLKKIYYKDKLNIIYNKEYEMRCNILDKFINQIIEIEKNKECYKIKDLKINGKIIKELGYSGAEIGEKLEYLLEEVIKNPKLNEEKKLINLLI